MRRSAGPLSCKHAAIARQRGQRKIEPIEMVLQIKHFWEACSGVEILLPVAVGGLMVDEPVDGLSRGGVVWPGGRQQAHRAPGGLRGGAFALSLEGRIVITEAGFAEAAVGLLHAAQPVGGA